MVRFQKLNFLGGGLAKAGISKQIVAAQYIHIAEEVILKRFGEGALTQAKPVYVKNRTLSIEVMHPAISEEIRKQEEAITSEINLKIGHPEVIRIQCILPTQRSEY